MEQEKKQCQEIERLHPPSCTLTNTLTSQRQLSHYQRNRACYVDRNYGLAIDPRTERSKILAEENIVPFLTRKLRDNITCLTLFYLKESILGNIPKSMIDWRF